MLDDLSGCTAAKVAATSTPEQGAPVFVRSSAISSTESVDPFVHSAKIRGQDMLLNDAL
jgi:hypothetical protein